MSIANTPTIPAVAVSDTPARLRENSRQNLIDNVKDKSYERSVDLDPQVDSWKAVAAGSVVPLGLAGAAAFATYVSTHERVAMTAWIAVAIVGSASVISAASASRRRTVSVDRSDQGEKKVSHLHDTNHSTAK